MTVDLEEMTTAPDFSSPSWHECKAEVHWYEAHGIGKKKMKIKSFLD